MPALYPTQDGGHRVKWHAATVTGSLRSHSDARARARTGTREEEEGGGGSGVQQEQIGLVRRFHAANRYRHTEQQREPMAARLLAVNRLRAKKKMENHFSPFSPRRW